MLYTNVKAPGLDLSEKTFYVLPIISLWQLMTPPGIGQFVHGLHKVL